MKNDNLFDAFGSIDDRFIEEAEKVHVEKKRDSRQLYFSRFAMTACMLLLVVSITLSLYLFSDRTTPGDDVYFTEPNITANTAETETAVKNNGDFIIKDGVLISYIGHGGIVTIPDSVSAISGGAFIGSENITHLILGKNISSIDPLALRELTSLKNITVSRWNEHFKVSNGKLFEKTDDGIFVLMRFGKKSDEKILGLKTLYATPMFSLYCEN